MGRRRNRLTFRKLDLTLETGFHYKTNERYNKNVFNLLILVVSNQLLNILVTAKSFWLGLWNLKNLLKEVRQFFEDFHHLMKY